MISVGFWRKIKQILRIRGKNESLQSDATALQSASNIDLNRFKALQSEEGILPQESLELQKDSLQLGVAAGYTAHFIKRIESSLDRIESQMLTKDWFDHKFDEKIPEFANLMKIHEENDQKRFEIIQNILIDLKNTVKKTPEPIRSELTGKIEKIEAQLPLTNKMKELLEMVKEAKEISYEELASKLGISVSALRGLLSNMLKRTTEIERFEKYNKGWVRYTGKIDSKRFEAIESSQTSQFPNPS
jgi:DNA-binding CsgD family transcriptional regulator